MEKSVPLATNCNVLSHGHASVAAVASVLQPVKEIQDKPLRAHLHLLRRASPTSASQCLPTLLTDPPLHCCGSPHPVRAACHPQWAINAVHAECQMLAANHPPHLSPPPAAALPIPCAQRPGRGKDLAWVLPPALLPRRCYMHGARTSTRVVPVVPLRLRVRVMKASASDPAGPGPVEDMAMTVPAAEKAALRIPYEDIKFTELRGKNMLFFDFTAYIPALLQYEAKNMLITRPSRFGKSLFLDTFATYVDEETPEEDFRAAFGGTNAFPDGSKQLPADARS